MDHSRRLVFLPRPDGTIYQSHAISGLLPQHVREISLGGGGLFPAELHPREAGLRIN